MTKQIEAMKPALDTLENHVIGDSLLGGVKRASAIAALHDALDKAIEAQLSIEELLLAVDRVVNKYGCDKTGEPSDWTEWEDVRKALANVRKGT